MFNRLVDLGFETSESKEMIASVLVEEMFYVMKNNNPFNEKRYAQELSLLPNFLEDVDNKQESHQPLMCCQIHSAYMECVSQFILSNS
jgi:hypothetical protein